MESKTCSWLFHLFENIYLLYADPGLSLNSVFSEVVNLLLLDKHSPRIYLDLLVLYFYMTKDSTDTKISGKQNLQLPFKSI